MPGCNLEEVATGLFFLSAVGECSMEKIRSFIIGDNYDFLDELCSSSEFVVPGVFTSFKEAANSLEAYAVSGRMPEVILIDNALKHEYDGSNFAELIENKYEIPVLFVKGPEDYVTDDGFIYLYRPVSPGQLHESIRTAIKLKNLKIGMDFLCRNDNGETKSHEELGRTVLDEQYKSARRLQTMMNHTVQNTIEGVVLVNPHGEIEYINKALEEIVGKKRSEVIGKHIRNFKSDKFSTSLLHALKKIAVAHRPWKGNIRLGNRICDLFVGAINGRSGGLLGYVGIFADITHQRSVESKFIKAQKMEAVATLAGGIAHDFNNIILAMQANIEALLQLTEPDDIEQKYFGRLNHACDRAGELVRKFLNLSRNAREEAVEISVCSTVREVLDLLQSTIPDNISLETDIDEDTGNIMAGPGNIYEVIMNLVRNAMDALRGNSGTIKVAVNKRVLDTENSLGLDPGEYVKLTVADTGEGISDDVAGRIFEPFFSTKKHTIDSGSGLGLSVVHQIVEGLNGHIGLKSKPEEGTEFYIYLPVCCHESETEDETEVIEMLPEGPEHILWIYDVMVEESRRMPDFLRRKGFKVTLAAGAEEAENLFVGDPLKFDMVISDKVIRSIHGKSVFKEIFKLRSDIPAILLTRYSDTIEMSLTVANKLVMLIKPVEESTLEETVKVLFSKRNLSARLMQESE